MVFIWMVQHANAPVGCFYFIFISLKYNIVAPDYNKNTFVASVIGLRLYLPLYGRSKLRSNRCLHLRLLPPFWKWTADSSFLKSRAYDFEQSWRWLAKLCLSTHPPLAAIFGKRVQHSPHCSTTLLGVFIKFPEIFVLDHVGSTSSFQESSSEVLFHPLHLFRAQFLMS